MHNTKTKKVIKQQLQELLLDWDGIDEYVSGYIYHLQTEIGQKPTVDSSETSQFKQGIEDAKTWVQG